VQAADHPELFCNFALMNPTLITIFSYSAFIPGIICLLRISNTVPAYYPFIYFILVGCLSEIISSVLIAFHHQSIISSNIYVLLEALLITWFFKRNRLFKKSPYLYLLIQFALLLFWITEVCIIKSIWDFSMYFRIFYSLIVVLMSIHTINQIIAEDSRSILRNPTFILCAGFILYFTYKILVSAFWMYGLKNSMNFLLSISNILAYINLFTNFIYGFVALWMPSKTWPLTQMTTGKLNEMKKGDNSQQTI
jgi:hypothetical protein